MSSGVIIAASRTAKPFTFVQPKIYDYLNGFQLSPEFTASFGELVAF